MRKSGSDASSELELIKEEERFEEQSIVYDKIFVAAGKELKENKLNVTWALQNSGGREIWLIHVLAPPEIIVGKPLKNQGAGKLLMADDEAKSLDSYVEHCRKAGNRAQTLCIEASSIEEGIITLISEKKIGRLVMGAAAENKYKKNMKELKSQKAMSVFLKAPAFCQIWFVCKGSLVCTRAGAKPESGLSRSGSQSVSTPLVDITQAIQKSKFDDSNRGSTPRKSQGSSDESDHLSRLRRSASSHPFASSIVVEVQSPSSVKHGRSDLETLLLPHDENFLGSSSSPDAKTSPRRNVSTLSDQLYNVMAKADNLRMGIIDAIHKGEAMENLYHEERKRRKELEEDLSKKNEELHVISNHSSFLQKEIESYKKERDELSRDLDNALSENGRLRSQVQQMDSASTHVSKLYADFSFLEIKEATCDFNPSMKIGEGGYGITYKGVLRHTEVAIKVPKPNSLQGAKEFNQEVEVLSRLRHPNIVTLIGVCSEASALIYEYAPNGSLEDRLTCKDDSPPLSWQARVRIAHELCRVLIFLQSSKPESIIHGDLKPANVLLDTYLSCKLSDFGICRGIKSMTNSATTFHLTAPKGTFSYVDPQFVSTGELSPKSDVYSFGIILLRMLTGKLAMNIKKEVQPVLAEGNLSDVMDISAGEWPIEQATWMAELALRCCEVNRRDRPDIATVWEALNR